ncbi:MAG TPA: 2-phospho-L-lactate transferase [Pseudonocardiaceae bacterium]|nr:2-phospho-L-lactate transferase [Pseudonocardiaceae bacterium]
MRVVVLVGGVGGARFLLGVKAALGLPAIGEAPSSHPPGAAPPTPPGAPGITAVVNTGDDIWLHDLRICPDLDTCMYTLGGGVDTERGWGRAAETWMVREELAGYGAEPDWFGLGDRDLATHLVRTRMLRVGYPLSAVTAALCDRWRPGVRLLPATDDRCETHVVVDDTRGRRAMHFQEWWIRHRAALPASAFVPVGADEAEPAVGVLDAITGADVVLLAPSNPVVSIGSVLAVPGIRGALRATPAPVIGLSPIVAGRAVRGMAEACLAAIGVPSTADAVGRHYGSRSAGGILDGWLVHTGDGTDVPGVAVRQVPLLMTDVAATAAMAAAAMELAGLGP